ncbi:HAMP domain-containing sensor histidine kinase, partial [Schnuerera sp.]|uniref:sensor histidine kinase n=1 Tax=Schnuerera sp. TaxID=2794844 RepID=UPI002D0558FC
NGFAEMLSTGEVSKEDTIKFANIIQKEGTRLLELIDSIIHLTHIEDEIESQTMETTNISNIAKEVISQLTISAKNKGLNLSLTAGDITIDANKRMIKDLLYNLVDNAIKYNKPKGIIHVSLEERKDFCIIRVKDTGIGIPEEEQNKVFERFYMVDKSRSKKVGGSGLGLSIVKHIVAYHNGRISLASKLNKGTEIEIQLPI